MIGETPGELPPEHYRTNFRRDYGRLVHTASFRRLTGKTQLYPGKESDFFRNRLSHSVEVAQIAKSIAIRLNALHKFPSGKPFDLDTDLVEFAALAHDIGHPPFGHQGEEALDRCMINDGGFEGNAQTLRILAKTEKRFLVDSEEMPVGIDSEGNDMRYGLNLTVRALASILKYDKKIPSNRPSRLHAKGLHEHESHKLKAFKGYYESEEVEVDIIKDLVTRNTKYRGPFKTIECSIMDLADDIAYSTYDLEDGLKAEFYHPLDIIFSKDTLLHRVSVEVSERMGRNYSIDEVRDVLVAIFDRWLFPENLAENLNELREEPAQDVWLALGYNIYKTSKAISKSAYPRVQLTSYLVGKFIRGVEVHFNQAYPMLSQVYFNEETKLMVETLKTFNYQSMILSPRLKIAEYRGMEIVSSIFETLADEKKHGPTLMPKDFQQIYSSVNNTSKKRVICDYIAGMTDRYCIEFYGRLKSENPETIFKPY